MGMSVRVEEEVRGRGAGGVGEWSQTVTFTPTPSRPHKAVTDGPHQPPPGLFHEICGPHPTPSLRAPAVKLVPQGSPFQRQFRVTAAK
jgi:hypothetical protein